MMSLFLRALTLVLGTLLLSGCVLSYHESAPRKTLRNGTLLKQTYYHAETTAEDGTRIRFTVYQPRMRTDHTTPLLIHAHGYGLSRMARPLSFYGTLLPPGEIALQAWHDGYFVISYDQRGHGSTGDSVGLIRPDKEADDVSRIIDWAVRNLPLATDNNDPVVGMLGESYGGAVQLLASTRDVRIDAIVPITTWFNLDQALFPNGVPKTSWISFLGAIGYVFNPFHMDNGMSGELIGEMFGNNNPHLRKTLQNNSLSAHCGNGVWPKADALLMPGMRDVLFPYNQSVDMQRCFKMAGKDVRLVAIADGHLLPGSQWSTGTPVWEMQDEVSCGGKTLQTAAIIRDWLDGKLKGDDKALARVPHFCLTGDELADARQQIGEWQEFRPVHVGSGMSGQFELLLKPLDHVGNWLRPAGVPANWDKPHNGWIRPARVPLLAPKESTWVAGVPRIALTFSQTDRDDPVLYLRLAKWRPGSGSYTVLNQQVTPVHAKGPLEFELGGVNARIEPGEVLGLLVTGWNSQFRFAGSGSATDASVAGRIALPLVSAAPAPAQP